MITRVLFNTEIESALSSVYLPYFKGVFSSDNIPVFNDHFSIICNLSNVAEKGTHFIAISRINSTLFILDSLALNIANNALSTYINEIGRVCTSVIFLKAPIQSIRSNACGFYCIFFTLLFHASLQRAAPKLYHFTDILEDNDAICIQNINMLASELKINENI